MKILHISDTHGMHRQLTGLPDADVIVHSGDFTMAGTEDETSNFISWFRALPYHHKIFIAGNHDDCLYGAEPFGLGGNCHYLCNSGIRINGERFYGVPLFMEDAVNGNDRHSIQNIPDDTDVLITHQPPSGILDFDGRRHYGSPELLLTAVTIRPKLHLFGHMHSAFGNEVRNGILFSNATVVDEQYILKTNEVATLSPVII